MSSERTLARSPAIPVTDPALFVGRNDELDVLGAEFRRGARIGLVVGERGVGKTSLARVFSILQRDLFPGGVTFTSATRGAEVRITQDENRPYLAVIDDAEFLEPRALDLLVKDVTSSNAARVLLVGTRYPIIPASSSFLLHVSPLAREEVKTLLAEVESDIDPERIAREFGGNPHAILAAVEAIRRGVSWEELIAGLGNFSVAGIVGAGGERLGTRQLNRSPLIIDVRTVNAELLEVLDRRPADWWELPPRRFEEVVAEILNRKGYQVELTPESDDGGFDIYAAKKDGLGEFLYLVECKRYVPPHKVGVHVIRALNGTLAAERANGAAVVTTSFFTRGAKAYQATFEKMLKLHDYVTLQKWLTEIRRK